MDVDEVFGDECTHDRAEAAKLRAANGGWRCGFYCWDCGQWILKYADQAGVWLPNELFDVDVLPVVEYAQQRICEHCKQLEFCEEHHYAPKEFFGDDADNWPTGWLCVECHERWHERIGQPIRKPAA
jgi:hypothetical protein